MGSRPKAARRFTTLDAMILVGSVAAGFGLLRYWWGDFAFYWRSVSNGLNAARPPWSPGVMQDLAADLLLTVMPFAVPATVAMLALRLRGPRPRWRRLARQPGWMAGLAAAFGLAAAGLFTEARYHWTSPYTRCAFLVIPEDDMTYRTFAHAAAPLAGFAVAVAWATLLVGRRWRAEASWVDRLGRLAGVGWIAPGLLGGYLALHCFP